MSRARRPTGERSPARMRGQPVIMLALVLGGWSLLRAATWASPIVPPAVELPVAGSAAPALIVAAMREQPTQSHAQQAMPPGAAPVPVAPWPMLPVPIPPGEALQPAPPVPLTPPQAMTQRVAAGHAMLMAAGFARMELPPELAAWFNARSPGAAVAAPVDRSAALLVAPPSGAAASAPARRASRWTADGWLLWRDDTTTPLASGRPSYGRSQVGAVARYNLAPASGHRPQAYLRAAAALQGDREEEVALGLSARPSGAVPLRVAAELRVSQRDSRFAGGTQVRPAVYAVTELAPQSLPLGATAEAYAQAGYVSGEGHTAFVDGQVRVDRSVVRRDDFDLRAGGGAWGGAQRGSARLDVGPSAAVTFRLGEARGRLAADYRFRVAGDAQPASGPALTLSAGF
ncbi:MAG: hypothetical protein ABIT10_07055 [Alteraurantiacibacter sp.]